MINFLADVNNLLRMKLILNLNIKLTNLIELISHIEGKQCLHLLDNDHFILFFDKDKDLFLIIAWLF